MSQTLDTRSSATTVRAFKQHRFYFAMSLVTAAVVAYGFHFTVQQRLLHPAVQPPAIIWVHASISGAWLLLFITQTGLVSTRKVSTHTKLGLLGIALGTALVIVGVWTTIAMARFHAANPVSGGPGPAFMIVPLSQIATFAALFAAGIALRRKDREAHRRLMFLATCVLTAPGWGRIPDLPPGTPFYGVDILVLAGIARDLVLMRRLHAVYVWVFPVMIVSQIAAMAILLLKPAWWMAVVNAIAN